MAQSQIEIVQGISFFQHPQSCIAHFNDGSRMTKMASSLQSYGTLVPYCLGKIGIPLSRVESRIHEYTKIPALGFSAKRLVICLHGLNSAPTQFKRIVGEINRRTPEKTDIFVPYILKRGNATLDELVGPIFEVIAQWAKTGSEKELVLVGVSNGGRIARAIEARLGAVENVKRLRSVSIVGACKGSSAVSLANRLHVSWVINEHISREMATTSTRTLRLNREWKEWFEKSGSCTREYTFIASPHDWLVPNYESTLPEIPARDGVRTRYAIIPGHGHNSIVNASAQAVAEIIVQEAFVRVS